MSALPAVTAWSYSRYSDYDRCPAFFKYKHLEKRPEPGSPAMARGNTIHKMAEDYLTGKLKTLPPELKNYKSSFNQLRGMGPMVEQAWGFKKDFTWTGRQGWFGDDVWFRAKADAFIVYDDNTADLIDHKTGKKYEVNNDQVELFTLAAFMRVPTLEKVTTRLWYLDMHPSEEVEKDFTRDDAARIQKEWSKKVVPMFVDKKFAPKPNRWCGRCTFAKANGGPCKF
jgi:hypothetical protein